MTEQSDSQYEEINGILRAQEAGRRQRFHLRPATPLPAPLDGETPIRRPIHLVWGAPVPRDQVEEPKRPSGK